MSVDRDRIVEQALKHELHGDSGPTPSCLDAETISAWHDGGLDAAQLSAAELHASTCPRCQSMLAAFARGATSTHSVLGSQGTEGTEGTFRFWKWWLAPIAAGAAAVTLWMVVPDQQRTPTGRQMFERGAAATDAPQSQAKVAPSAEPVPPPPAAPAQTFADNTAPKRDAEEKKLADASRDDRRLRNEAALKEEQALDKITERPAPPPASPMPTPPPAATVAVGAVAAPGARAEAISPGSAVLQRSAPLAVATLEVPTLDRNIRWRIIGGNSIERTEDNGTTWRILFVPNGVVVRAGSAPTNAIAWFGANSGIVFLTTDGGASFQTFSIGESLDIASISAFDARSAVVSTVSGRRFRTQDGGRVWTAF